MQSLAFDLNYLQFSLLCILCFRWAKHTNKVTCQKHFIILIIAHFFCLSPIFQAQPGPRSQVTGYVSLWRFLCVWPPFFVFGRLCVLRNVVFNVGACYRQILCHSWVSYLKDKNAASGGLIHRRVKAGSSQKRTFDGEDV